MYLQETINHQKRKFTSFTKIQISNSSFLQYDYYRNAETCMCNASTGGRPPLQFHYSISNIYRVWCVYLALQGSYMLLLLRSTFCYLSFLSVFHSGGEGVSGESLSSTEIFRGGAAILPGPGRDLNMMIAFTATKTWLILLMSLCLGSSLYCNCRGGHFRRFSQT